MTYSCILLSEEDQAMLKEALQESLLPHDWEIYAHHVTLNIGRLPKEYAKYLDAKATIEVVSIGVSDTNIALGVLITSPNVLSVNKIPHITMCVNKVDGGKPVDSNYIEKWEPILAQNLINLERLKLKGIIKEL